MAIVCGLIVLQEIHRTFGRFGQWGDALGLILAVALFVLLGWPG